MAGDPVPSEERRLRLQRVREEIQREMGQGITLSDADWLGLNPDLESELRIMLRELIGSGLTQLAGGPAGALETLAGTPDPSHYAPPVETIASSTPPEPATLDDPDAGMARMPSVRERTEDLASDASSRPTPAGDPRLRGEFIALVSLGRSPGLGDLEHRREGACPLHDVRKT